MALESNVLQSTVAGLSAMGNFLNQREELNMKKQLFQERQAEKAKQQEINNLRGMQALMEAYPDNWHDMLSPEQKKIADVFYQQAPQLAWARDPQTLQQTELGIQQIHQGMEDPNGINSGLLVQGVNNAFADQLNKGSANDGQPASSKQITRLYPSSDGGGFYAQLRVTPQSGQPYDAPLTEGRDSSPDAAVKRIDIGDAMRGMRNKQAWINYAKARMVALGDEETWKQMRAEQKGKRMADVVRGVDNSAPFDEQRRAMGVGFLENGSNLGETAGAVGALAPQPKFHAIAPGYAYTLDDGKTIQYTEPTDLQKAEAQTHRISAMAGMERATGKGDSDSDKLIRDQMKDLDGQLSKLSVERAKMAAKKGSTTMAQDEFGNMTRHTVNDVDINAIDAQINEVRRQKAELTSNLSPKSEREAQALGWRMKQDRKSGKSYYVSPDGAKAIDPADFGR